MAEDKICNKCLLHEPMNGVHIAENGVCNVCNDYKPYIPYGEKELLKHFHKAKKKHRLYDALVPLSGGKDSTYILYLAVKKYHLNVLTFTFDNGLMSDLAKSNIDASVKKCGVDHIWVRHNPALIQKLYKAALMQSGEICGICGIGIERSMLKISESWKIPIILLGHSPTEANSFTTENIYDQERIKAIITTDNKISESMLNRFMIYPKLNFINAYIYSKTGRLGKKINPLFYLPNPSDKEIATILKQEMDWREPEQSEYTRHFDCVAEPFTNFIREQRFGNSRRLPQLSNMIRNGELTRKEALQILEKDKIQYSNNNYEEVKAILDLSDIDIEHIKHIPTNVFSANTSFANMFFAKIRYLIKGKNH